MQHFVEEIAKLLIKTNLPQIEYEQTIETMHQVNTDVNCFRKRKSDLSPQVQAALVVYQWYKSYD